jgi:hypothetical protein
LISLTPEGIIQEVYEEYLNAGLIQSVLPIKGHELSAHPVQLRKRERGRRELDL